MPMPEVPTCRRCGVPMRSHGNLRLSPNVMSLVPFGPDAFHVYVCPSCNKVDCYLSNDPAQPQEFRHDRRTWTCACGQINAGKLEHCERCQRPRSYDIE